MFGRAIWDKFPECIFENFEIKISKNHEGNLIPKISRTKHVITG